MWIDDGEIERQAEHHEEHEDDQQTPRRPERIAFGIHSLCRTCVLTAEANRSGRAIAGRQ